MNIKAKLLAFVLSLGILSGALAGCEGGSGGACNSEDPTVLYTTPLTDKLAFPYESDYATKNFDTTATTGVMYGKVTLGAVTDGDTASFTTVNGTYMRVRFLGINTPESTAKVEPWGVKASKWMATVFEKAVDFCLVTDVDVHGTLDSSGSRALAFVWYKTAANDELHPNQWRLYNLECVEQCYSENFLFEENAMGYLDPFLTAHERGETCGYRVHGAKDPDYNYAKTVSEVTCYYVRHNFDKIGIDFQGGGSGSYLHITGLVVGQMGDNMVIRDLVRDVDQLDDDPLECLYVYAGYSSALGSKVAVGDIARFYCRASKYPKTSTNIQLVDVSTRNAGKYIFETITPDMEEYAELLPVAPSADMDPVIPDAEITTIEELSKYYAYYCKLRVQVREIHHTEIDDDGNEVEVNGYFRETFNSQNGLLTATTVYAHVAGTEVICNIRIDGQTSGLRAGDFAVGDVWEFKAYLSMYYENYQIQVFNLDKTISNAVKIS